MSRHLPSISSREQLACVLRSASELEHLLSCQYLFAAFSMKKTVADFPEGGDETEKRRITAVNQRWAFKVMQIARQEMEHLGIVNNLLGAIGEPPYFARPNFPIPRSYLPIDAPFVLQRFGRASLERFLVYERPDYLDVPGEWRRGGPQRGCLKAVDCGIRFRDVQQLYEEVANAFKTLPPAEIFAGDSRRQVDNDDTPAFGLAVTMMPVTNRETAAQAIDLILEQGEGIGGFPLAEDSHFASFNAILQELLGAGPSLKPALRVVENPLVEKHTDCHGTLITHPYSLRALKLFNRAYGTMLAFLERFFLTYRGFWGRPSDVTGLEPLSQLRLRTRNAALLEQAFFPFMTMVIRPLGDFLVRLPAFDGDEDGPRAGPSFELADGQVPVLEDFPRALEGLASEARALADATGEGERRKQLTYIADSISRMHQNFARVWNAVP